jgi:paraquat-inducible protein B
MESILAGGIAFATPEGKEMGSPVNPDHHFVLQAKIDEDWLTWKPKIELQVEFKV